MHASIHTSWTRDKNHSTMTRTGQSAGGRAFGRRRGRRRAHCAQNMVAATAAAINTHAAACLRLKSTMTMPHDAGFLANLCNYRIRVLEIGLLGFIIAHDSHRLCSKLCREFGSFEGL